MRTEIEFLDTLGYMNYMEIMRAINKRREELEKFAFVSDSEEGK